MKPSRTQVITWLQSVRDRNFEATDRDREMLDCAIELLQRDAHFTDLSEESARSLAAGFADVKAVRVQPIDPKFLEQADDEET